MSHCVVIPVSRLALRLSAAVLFGAVLLMVPFSVNAGSTGSTALFMPQGSSAGTGNGDYITATTGGLNMPYHYFIEVPSGAAKLRIQIFDADIGAGGTAEAGAGRDRDRTGFNTTATYSLIDPSGATRTPLFTTGNTTSPTGADNAWLDFYNITGKSVADNFGTASYSNNDGNTNWSAAWIETDTGGAGPAAGAIQITGGELRINGSGGPSLEREADLLGTPGLDLTIATFSFDYRTTAGLKNGDRISVQVSSNGGGAWTTLETFSGSSSGSRSYSITSFIANNTRVRFIVAGGYTGAAEFFFVDNVKITDAVLTAGHWELRVSQSATGDDINAIGIRADDGDSTSGGTELNVYYDSHTQIGVNPPASGTNSRSYTLYPYVTSGCSASGNNFDYDQSGSITFTRRSGGFTQTFSNTALSTTNTWVRNTFTGWGSDQQSIGDGIWQADLTITSIIATGVPNGNYANFWMANFQAAANPPTTNPTTDAFRVYLPTDAVAAPVKPYLEQLLTFSGCGLSGPNPPVAGQTSCFTVTVRLVNPTAQAITFSASNLVTANIPGGGAVYAGTPQVSQGTIVSQPAVGGTGNVTWNPGTVAAGGTALLAYLVNVTPTMAGQRIPVTGTPASGNGTRAQFVDETGNTTQARATFLFGPLCELAAEANLLTEAVVSSFHASKADGGGMLLEWTTASEAGTAGFYLQRWDGAARRWTPVNGELLTGLLQAQGGTYRFVDEGASPLEPQVYRLEEVEAGGRRRAHGPFTVAVDWQRPDPRDGGAAYERQAHPVTRRAEAPAFPDLPATKALAVKASSKRDGGIHLSVRDTGLYYLSAVDVAAWLDLTPEKAGKRIADGKLALTRGGQAVAWYPDFAAGTGKDKTAQGLFFYGEALGSLYGDASVYRLQGDGPSLLMQTVAAPAAPAAEAGTFPESLHSERDVFAATVISPDPESDYWFWEFLQGDSPTYGQRTFTLDAPGVSGAGGGSLTVSLHGATATGVADEHQVAVSLNGTPLGETRWSGIAARQATFPVPPGVLLPAGNQVALSARTGDGAPYSIFYLDGFDLGYQRSFRAAGDTLAFTSGGSPQVTVAGFSAPGVRLLDVQDPLRPLWITGAAVAADPGSGYQLALTSSAQGHYVAAAPAAFKAPAAVRAWSAPALRSTANRADYLVVAPAGLRDAAERLADLRRAQGLEAMVVDLDQIMDELNFGVPSPHALRSFLAYARANWSLPPRYVALAGEGTVDYRNLLGHGDNLVPPLMVQSTGGLFPSDNRLGDVNGDGRPEMAVGRIPVLSAAELDAYTAKIAAYESAATADWAANLVMLADAPDQGADFSADSERIAGQIPAGYALDRIYLSATPFADARARLLGDLDRGASFVNYMGHGGLDRLSAGGLLSSGDVPGLGNGARLPVLTAMTCTVNRFAVPGFSALGELLVKSPTGGAAAVWGPSGLSSNGDARLLAERFYHSAGAERLGDRILRAIAEFRSLGGDPALPPLYSLLGDPALRVPAPVPAVAAPGGSGE